MVRFSRVSLAAVPMCHPSVIRSRPLMRHHGGNTLKSQDHHEGLRALPRNPMECVRFRFRFSSKKCLDIEPYFLLEKVIFAVFIEFTGSEPLGQRFVELTCSWAASVGIRMRFPHLTMPN